MAYYIKGNIIENGCLTILLRGEINSYTSQEAQDEILDVINKNKLGKYVLDFEDVTYVSSAGLRVILKLKQAYKDVSIINASLQVYDVFDMTGFTNIMDIKKALTKVDVSNSEIIGEGFFSTVYRIDKDTIVKAYKNDTDIENVERELKLAKEAFVLGIPTAISFDVVKVNDKLGVRFEMLNSILLRDLFKDNEANFDEYIAKYAELLKKINTTETMSENLPRTKDLVLGQIDTIKDHIGETDYKKIKRMVSEIEDRNTFVHGDCHIKNIMVQDNELFLIDMDTLSKGHPIFELSSLIAPYILFELDDPGNNMEFLINMNNLKMM